MIFTNFKLKIRTKQSGYDAKYAAKYFERRKKDLGESREYFQNLIHRYRIDVNDKTILDLAAGPGMDLKILSEFTPKTIIWHDKMKGPYEVARSILGELKNVKFNLKDIMDLDIYDSSSIDFAMCRQSFHYVGNDYYFLKQIMRILRPGGFFWVENVNLEFCRRGLGKGGGQASLIRKIKNNFFDWPLYKLTGLRFFSFLPIDPRRLQLLFKKLGYSVMFLKSEEGFVEFLIQKPR